MIRVVITGGGTGGHLYPALAVAEALKADPEVSDLLYIGNVDRKEAELVPQHGIGFAGIRFSGMPRRISPAMVGWGISLIQSWREARRLIQSFSPQVVFGTGGYVTAPVLLAALSLGVPYVIHEPDAYPGLVNRVMARWAGAVTCAFGRARERLKTGRFYETGNPLRGQMGQISREEALAILELPFSLEKPIVLVTGGSQGARRINQAVIEALPHLIDAMGVQVLHQTGEKLYEETLNQCSQACREHPAYWVAPFITQMAAALALADVAVCRAGSMTLSEMYQAGIPTILVPYPFAAADHQRQNALASQVAGASRVIEDSQLTGTSLVAVLEELMESPAVLAQMRQASQRLSHPDATARVVEIIKSVAHPHAT